jgi:hypothetical protein
MDDLLFYSLLIALAYYFLVYTQPTRPDPQPTTHSKSTQTEPTTYGPEPTIKCPPAQTEPTLTKEDQTLLEQTLDQLIKGINDFNKEIDKM